MDFKTAPGKLRQEWLSILEIPFDQREAPSLNFSYACLVLGVALKLPD